MALPVTPTPTDTPAVSVLARGARFEPLAARAPVSIDRSACLRLRTHLAECRACAAVCPTQAIAAGQQTLELGAGCTGCGRCQAVCPSAALEVEGFEIDAQAVVHTHAVVTVECQRAPAGNGALRVPCLGGLPESTLLSLCAAQARVVLVDRGWCAACESGGGAHSAQPTLDRVNGWLAQAGVPAPLRPHIAPVAPGLATQRAGTDPMQSQGRARRGFFAALARPASEVPRSACAPARSEPSGRRQQTLASLQVLTQRHGGHMPSALFHRLDVAAACRGHRVCASACPTGALVRWRDDGAARMGLAFDNASCIGCGHCAAVCPEQALQLQRGAGEVGRGRKPLTIFQQRECADCGSRFAAPDGEDETRCQRCRTSARLVRSAFQTLFGARP